MATTVTAWVRINPASTNASAFASNDAVLSAVPLTIRLHPAAPDQTVEDFQLPYNPLQVSYGDLADEIAQIPRPGTTPIVAFKAHRLMTVNFSFILAQPGDGLATSIDDKLQILRKFASSANRVISLINFDSLTNTPFSFRNSTQERLTDGLFFNIVEMSVESVRRNKNNQISQANVTLSLIENRNPLINVAFIPPIKLSRPKKKCKDAKFRKKFPNQCNKKKVDKVVVPKSSEVSLVTAEQTLDSAKADFKSTFCFEKLLPDGTREMNCKQIGE